MSKRFSVAWPRKHLSSAGRAAVEALVRFSGSGATTGQGKRPPAATRKGRLVAAPFHCRRSPRSGGELCRFRFVIRPFGQRLAQ